MTRQRFVKISKRIASAAICVALMLFCASCTKTQRVSDGMKSLYATLKDAQSAEYRKSVFAVMHTSRGSYEMEYEIISAHIANGNSVNEISARQMDKEVSLTSFSNGGYTFTPLYSDFYVKRAAQTVSLESLVPYPEKSFGSVKSGFYESRPAYEAKSNSENLRAYTAAQLIGCVNFADFTGLEWDDADFGEMTFFISSDSKTPFFAICGSFSFEEKDVSVDYTVEFDLISVNSLEDVVFPLEEGKLEEVLLYSDFIKTLEPIAPLITQSQWAVLLGYAPENEFDFYSFEFDEYAYPLYWEEFFDVIL
ncbi:MAG: hypothetical protein IJD95_01080 [Clostridia bacterium]|nr:hypothetical protein [Clostridia bacterium]